MHCWGDEGVDWKGINAAAKFIATNLKRWGRVQVRDYKEKWGTVRVYCSLGWHQFHCITHPGYFREYNPIPITTVGIYSGSKIISVINPIVQRYHAWLYRAVYWLALKKWPHLKQEILNASDYDELLKGL